jgi:hypothetical protein
VYGKLLGKEEITEEDLKTKFVSESILQEKNLEAKQTKVELEILKKIGREAFTNEENKSFLDVAKKAIDFEEDGELKGLEILNPLINKTPRKPNVPPADDGTKSIKAPETKEEKIKRLTKEARTDRKAREELNILLRQ